MPIQFECSRLALKIREILERGVELDPPALHFIDSTFFNPTTEKLDALLKTDGRSERDILLEFLVSPDESFQLQLEGLLAAHPVEKESEEKVAGLLDSPPPTMVLRFSDGRGVLRVELTPSLVRRLLSHLKLAWRPPPGLASMLDTVANLEDRNRLRIRLRNCRVDWSPAKVAFMTKLLETGGIGSPHDLECIDFALEFLADIGHGVDVSQALDRRKRLLVRALQQSRRQSELLEKSNLESLVSCGVRLIHVDEAAACLQLAHIDRISLAVYGRVHQVPWADVVEIDSGEAFDRGRHFF
jgi:hypothetical protein